MDFLREAVTKSHRFMELRDLLLLLARVACLLAFGCALARPYWNHVAATAQNPNQPVHAVMLVDNSLSMGYQTGDGILLDKAKAAAKQKIEELPSESIVTVLPTCGALGVSGAGMSFEAHARKEDALEALGTIAVVDRPARSGPVIDLAHEACRRITNMSAKRIFLFTDQQVQDWSSDAESDHLKQLPCPMQVVQVKPEENSGEIENVWVSDVQLRDGVANALRPASITATINYQGSTARHDVPVVLKVDGVTASVEKIELQPGQSREVTFPDYRISPSSKTSAGTASNPSLSVEVSIPASGVPFDRLPADNTRSIVVPIVGALPVVFVDPIANHEDVRRKIRGDTWWLRRWLVPSLVGSRQKAVGSNAAGGDGASLPTSYSLPPTNSGLVEPRLMTIDQMKRANLADARLVVIAGVAQPTPDEVTLLMEYVEQGGNVLLAAGGRFDPAAWTDVAWKDGLGILPTPLAAAAVGFPRDDRSASAAAVPPVALKFSSLAHEYFHPDGVSDEDLRAMLGPPTLFFKTVVALCDDGVKDRAVKAALGYFTAQRDKLAEIDRKVAELQKKDNVSASGSNNSANDSGFAQLKREREAIEPDWLVWRRDQIQVDANQDDNLEQKPAELAEKARPAVLASYTNDKPMLLRRRWGRGQVLFLTTSLSRDWTTLHDLPQSAWLIDRIARSLLAETVPSKNFSSEQGLVLPIAATNRNAQISLIAPDGTRQSLSVDSLGGDRFGVSLGNWTKRGIYHVVAVKQSGDSPTAKPLAASQITPDVLWDIPLAVNGPASESKLVPDHAADASNGAGHSFVDATGQAFSSTSGGTGEWTWWGIEAWKWLGGLVLFLLLAELLLAARVTPRGAPAAQVLSI